MQNGVVDAHATGMGLFHQALLFGLVITEIVERQRPWAFGDVIHGLLQAVIGDDRQQRAKDFLVHDLHAVVGVKQQGGGQDTAAAQVFIARIQYDHLSTFIAGILQQCTDALVLARIDDLGVVGVIRQARV